MSLIKVEKLELQHEANQLLVFQLLDEYARDIMGGGEALSDFVKENLGKELAKRPTAHVFVALYNDEHAGNPSTTTTTTTTSITTINDNTNQAWQYVLKGSAHLHVNP